MAMNDIDQEHDKARKRLGMSWEEYSEHLAQQIVAARSGSVSSKVGSEEEQLADVLAQLRSGGSENKIRADTIERLLNTKKGFFIVLEVVKPKKSKKKKNK